MLIICPFCETRNMNISYTKNENVNFALCGFCDTCIFFPKKLMDNISANLSSAIEMISSKARIIAKDMTYDLSTPIINKFSCMTCGEKATKAKKTKKEDFIFIKCSSCRSRMFIRNKYLYILDIAE